MKRAIRSHLRDFIAIIGLLVLALAIGVYIVTEQRLRLPWESDPIELKASFSTAQAVIPGQGQTVRVAGVEIGDVTGSELENGKAVVTMEIDPEYEGMVHEDATALLRPRTALKDMFVELDPGSPDAAEADEGFEVPISNTLPDVNPDEFLSVLDADTRQYLKLLLKGAGDGLKGRGEDLREVLKRFEPTHRDLARVSSETVKRRRELRRLVTSLNLVSGELARNDDTLAQLVDSASRSFGTLADRQAEVSETVRRLPGTLGQATQALNRVEGMAQVLGPAATELRRVPPALIRSNRAVRPFALEAVPLLRRDIRPFARAAQPAVAQLAQSAPDLADSEPGLLRTFEVLNRFGNMAGHNPRGRESPETPGRDEGYLFHSAWGGHQLNGVFAWADAHGSGRKLINGGKCADYRQIMEGNPLAGIGLGLPAIMNHPQLCAGPLR